MKNTSIIVIAFILFVLLLNSIYFVREDEYAIIKRFDRIVDIKEEAGLGVKIPFVDNRSSLTKKYIMYDLAPTDVLTKDKKSMEADTYTLCRIVDPRVFLQTTATLGELQLRVESTVYGVLKTTISELDQDDIIKSRTDTDNSINNTILRNATTSLSEFGVLLVDVQIKRFDLPDANKNAVYERMISERNQMAATYTADGEKNATLIRNNTNKEKEILLSEARAEAAALEAEGESEYMKILSDAYYSPERAEFYEFIRTLDALKIAMQGDKTLILPRDAVLADGLIGRGEAEKSSPIVVNSTDAIINGD